MQRATGGLMLQIPPLHPSIGIDDLRDYANAVGSVMHHIRATMLAPEDRKRPPVFNTSQLAELCGVDKSTISRMQKRGELPAGTRNGNRLEWSLKDARIWSRTIRSQAMRDPTKALGVGIAVANFKGGVSKTTTAATLAQGLSLRGHKVLVVDTDPQGSLTTLFGIFPDTEVSEDQTILPLCTGDTDTIEAAIQPTYWDGIDLVAAAPALYSAEFLLPSRQKSEQGFQFWRVLDAGLESAREKYDVIIFDTPPALGYLTINALIAADGLVMPLPPNALDFASSRQFWDLFTEICGTLMEQTGDTKYFNFIDILLARVDHADAVSVAVRQWILNAYGGRVLPFEIPRTSIAATASASFGTVYDMDTALAQSKTLKRALDAYDQFVNHIEMQVQGVWSAHAKGIFGIPVSSQE